MVNGVNNVNTQTVERRFKLPSSRSGMISSSYDFAAAIFGLFVSFFGSGRFKARWLTFAAVVMGTGSFIMALPHFTTPLYEWGADLSKTCSANGKICCSIVKKCLRVFVLLVWSDPTRQRNENSSFGLTDSVNEE